MAKSWERGGKKSRESQESAASSRRLEASPMALGPLLSSLPIHHSVLQQEGPFLQPKTFSVYILKVIPPFLPLPQLSVATAAAWLRSQTAPGVTGKQDPLSLCCTSLPQPRTGRLQLSGGCWDSLLKSLSFAQDTGPGKAPSLVPAMLQGHHFCDNIMSGRTLLLRNITREQVLTEDNGDALEPIQFQALNRGF